jgi:hypothetical protein
MKAAPERLVSMSGMEALRGVAILPGPRVGVHDEGATGLAIKIEDGDGYDRGTWAATVEALRQAGALDDQSLRFLAARDSSANLGRAVLRRDRVIPGSIDPDATMIGAWTTHSGTAQPPGPTAKTSGSPNRRPRSSSRQKTPRRARSSAASRSP